MNDTVLLNCDRCGRSFEPGEIQLSHDVPKYMGGLDKDGRHYLCKKCHDIYERLCFSVFFNSLSIQIRGLGKQKVWEFAKRYFKKADDDMPDFKESDFKEDNNGNTTTT